MAKTVKKRRVPQQARSKKRYQHILDTAAALFAQHGVDSVTTNHIADSAEISVGSIYQFFPNKDAIIDGLIDYYIQTASAIFPAELDIQTPIEQVIRGVMQNIVQFRAQHKGFQVVLIGLEGTSKTEAADKMQAATIAGIDAVLAAYYPALAPERRQLCALVSFSLVAGILPQSLPDDVMVDEMVAAVTAYQRQFLRREGVTGVPHVTRDVQRGDLFWLQLATGRGEVAAAHPYVVVQETVLNRSRIETVVVCALTSNQQRASEPGNLLLEAGEGALPQQSVVIVSQLETVEKAQLGAYIGTLSEQRVEQILAGLRFQQQGFFGRNS